MRPFSWTRVRRTCSSKRALAERASHDAFRLKSAVVLRNCKRLRMLRRTDVYSGFDLAWFLLFWRLDLPCLSALLIARLMPVYCLRNVVYLKKKKKKVLSYPCYLRKGFCYIIYHKIDMWLYYPAQLPVFFIIIIIIYSYLDKVTSLFTNKSRIKKKRDCTY